MDIKERMANVGMTQVDMILELQKRGYVWTVSRSETISVDKDALKADGLLDKYSKKSETYRMTVK